MRRQLLCAVAMALAWSAPLTGRAQDAELAKLREEVRQLKQAYESRLQALEQRLQEAEAKAVKTEPGAAQAQTAGGAGAGGRPAGESAFNPAVSLILQGTLAGSSSDPA